MQTVQWPIEGDAALLRLAQARLDEAGLGGELHPHSVDHLRELLAFRPAAPSTAHLPRNINVLHAGDREGLTHYARAAAGQLYGILIHDQTDFRHDPARTIEAFRETDGLLAEILEAPLLFIEYAVGIDTAFFARLFEETVELRHVCPAVDISHVGIFLCRAAFAQRFPGEDVCALRPGSPQLPERIAPSRLPSRRPGAAPSP
jgi:hypothetical protein